MSVCRHFCLSPPPHARMCIIESAIRCASRKFSSSRARTRCASVGGARATGDGVPGRGGSAAPPGAGQVGASQAAVGRPVRGSGRWSGSGLPVEEERQSEELEALRESCAPAPRYLPCGEGAQRGASKHAAASSARVRKLPGRHGAASTAAAAASSCEHLVRHICTLPVRRAFSASSCLTRNASSPAAGCCGGCCGCCGCCAGGGGGEASGTRGCLPPSIA